MNKNQGPAPPARGLTICLSYGREPDRDRAAGNCLEAPGGGGQRPTSRPGARRDATRRGASQAQRERPGGTPRAASLSIHPSIIQGLAGLKLSVTGRAASGLMDGSIWST